MIVNSIPRTVRISLFQTITGLFIPSRITGLRTIRYQPNPYEELAATIAATIGPSDSLTIETPVMTQNPTRISEASAITTGIAPSGKDGLPAMKSTAARTSVNQGTRNMPTVEMVFATAY